VPGSKANPCHDAPRNHAPALLRQLLWQDHPHRCAAWPATTPRHCATHSRTADVPHPRKRTTEPSKGRRTTTPRPPGTTPRRQASGGGHLRRHRPRATIPAIATPSRPLHQNPRHCGSVRRQYTAMPATVPCTASRQRHPRVLMRTAIKQATSTPPPSKPLLDAHRTRNDAPTEARFARTSVYSTTLYAIPPHIDRTVWHDVNCLLLGL
jgi:hypothetical protein